MTTTALPASDRLKLTGVMDTHLSRWLWLVKMFLATPHFVVLAVLWVPFILTTLFAGIAILVTGRYPRPLFELNVGILRWNWRVGFYVYAALGTDKYPPFSFADRPDYPAKFDVVYDAHPSRLSVPLRWFAAAPHLVIVALIMGDLFSFNQPSGVASAAFSLLNVFVVAAGVLLLVSGRYPQGLFDFLLGINRWVYRVLIYVAFMRTEYPPFRVDPGNPDDSLD